MTQDILIDGDTNHMWYGKNPVPLKTLTDLVTSVTPDLGMLPPVTRWISPFFTSPDGVYAGVQIKTAYAIVEARPNYRTIIFEDEAVRIPVPWQHYLYRFTQSGDDPITCFLTSVYYSLTPIESYDHNFYFAPLPNVFPSPIGGEELQSMLVREQIEVGMHKCESCSVCYGDFSGHTLLQTKEGWDCKDGYVSSFADAHTLLTNDFWSTYFNADYHSEWYEFVNSKYYETFDHLVDYDRYNHNASDFDHVAMVQARYGQMTIETMIDRLCNEKLPILKLQSLVNVTENLAHSFSLTEMFAKMHEAGRLWDRVPDYTYTPPSNTILPSNTIFTHAIPDFTHVIPEVNDFEGNSGTVTTTNTNTTNTTTFHPMELLVDWNTADSYGLSGGDDAGSPDTNE